MVVAICCYSAAYIYFVLKKQFGVYLAVNYLIAILALINVIVCPGNHNRGISEIAKWFPTYQMFDLIDKVDIGLFSTLQYIFIDNPLVFMLVIIGILVFAMCKRINGVGYKVSGVLPFILLLLIGPLKNITQEFFPNMYYLLQELPQDGLFTMESAQYNLTFCKYILFMVILGGLVILFLLCSDTWLDFFVIAVLLGSGLASRIAIGFSPIVYASGARTFEMFYLCILMGGLYMISRNMNSEIIKTDKVIRYTWVMYAGIIISLFDIFCLIAAKYIIF